ncbi:cell division protein FtsL [Marinobacter lutaoensis]|jgi:cell division protein FtsL|uniref:Cell division protein FtsL n=1 Tax=Marinobacter lutaoensis TaxID=135739 RepID=A0A1V2DQ60_9GAMM|nr:cell division protein FtsL [Marinobacter lutaoensis]MBI43582.1 cell division protein FtsL [Oceanospirillales bacterium]NVD35312.1 cell division protein FtsL [Marinobacter lutaoensis]ONF42659.1 cell division protein FtsL [Marinobacter lutaoensis]|tara:strand:+ start:2006 stop:2410 length:405 start_codon:yes stop_codon:yes gene_type:complete
MGAVVIERPAKTARLNKQRVRDGVATAVRLSRQVFEATRRREVLVSLGLVGVLLASSVGVVVAAHENRTLFNTLAELQGERDRYQREWSQLLLEQSALSAHGRVEKLAAERLGMVVPGREDIVLVPLMSPVASR